MYISIAFYQAYFRFSENYKAETQLKYLGWEYEEGSTQSS